MWSQLIAAAFALLFYQGQHTLAPGKQQVIDLAHLSKQGHVMSINVAGSGAGDIDCYLLVNHRIITKDEGNADACYLGMYVGTDEPIKLWIVNRGSYNTQYQVRVEE